MTCVSNNDFMKHCQNNNSKEEKENTIAVANTILSNNLLSLTDYVRGKKLGNGTYGAVYECYKKNDGAKFAMKVIKTKDLSFRELASLEVETSLISHLKHKNVISVFNVFNNNDHITLIMELCSCGDLFDQMLRMKNQRFNEKQAAYITLTLSRTVNYLHNCGIVHRDVKPENILFNSNGILKLNDFGLAHYSKVKPVEYHYMVTCCGTPHYAAPELLAGVQYNYAVDYWSIGVILYIMLVGYQPFNHQSVAGLYKLIIQGEYNFNGPHWNTISNSAKNCIKGLLDINPKNRYTLKDIENGEWMREQGFALNTTSHAKHKN